MQQSDAGRVDEDSGLGGEGIFGGGRKTGLERLIRAVSQVMNQSSCVIMTGKCLM